MVSFGEHYCNTCFDIINTVSTHTPPSNKSLSLLSNHNEKSAFTTLSTDYNKKPSKKNTLIQSNKKYAKVYQKTEESNYQRKYEIRNIDYDNKNEL